MSSSWAVHRGPQCHQRGRTTSAEAPAVKPAYLLIYWTFKKRRLHPCAHRACTCNIKCASLEQFLKTRAVPCHPLSQELRLQREQWRKKVDPCPALDPSVLGSSSPSGAPHVCPAAARPPPRLAPQPHSHLHTGCTHLLCTSQGSPLVGPHQHLEGELGRRALLFLSCSVLSGLQCGVLEGCVHPPRRPGQLGTASAPSGSPDFWETAGLQTMLESPAKVCAC